MPRARITVTLEEKVLKRLDRLVAEGKFVNRGWAIQEAIEEKFARLDRTRLARECSKIDPAFEKALAEEDQGEGAVGWRLP